MLVSGFARELATYVEGTPDDNGIHQAIRPLNKTFFSQIYSTAPRFSPFTRGTGQRHIHPTFPSSGDEPHIYSNGHDAICVDEVMDMEDR